MKRSERLSAKDRRLLKETLKELNRQGRLQEEKLAKQHGSTSVYQHSINVAYPVSYTHLDVYKRQHLSSMMPVKRKEETMERSSAFSFSGGVRQISSISTSTRL